MFFSNVDKLKNKVLDVHIRIYGGAFFYKLDKMKDRNLSVLILGMRMLRDF